MAPVVRQKKLDFSLASDDLMDGFWKSCTKLKLPISKYKNVFFKQQLTVRPRKCNLNLDILRNDFLRAYPGQNLVSIKSRTVQDEFTTQYSKEKTLSGINVNLIEQPWTPTKPILYRKVGNKDISLAREGKRKPHKREVDFPCKALMSSFIQGVLKNFPTMGQHFLDQLQNYISISKTITAQTNFAAKIGL